MFFSPPCPPPYPSREPALDLTVGKDMADGGTKEGQDIGTISDPFAHFLPPLSTEERALGSRPIMGLPQSLNNEQKRWTSG